MFRGYYVLPYSASGEDAGMSYGLIRKGMDYLILSSGEEITEYFRSRECHSINKITWLSKDGSTIYSLVEV